MHMYNKLTQNLKYTASNNLDLKILQLTIQVTKQISLLPINKLKTREPHLLIKEQLSNVKI